MSRLYLVRHGEPAAGFGEDADPGLSELGRAQAEKVAADLGRLPVMPIVTSPLRRCRETAEPLARAWGAEARVDEGVGEVRSPTDDLASRAAWLRGAMAGTWDDLGPAYVAWRDGVVAALLAMTEDTVAFSHFIAINAAIGEATGRRDVLCHAVGNCSVTVVENAGHGLRLVDAGAASTTVVH